MRNLKHQNSCRKTLHNICCCFSCCKKTTFDLRVDAEVSKAILAVKSRREELELTERLLQGRARAGDLSATVPLESAKARLKMFRREWNLDDGGNSICGKSALKKSLRYKVKKKVRNEKKAKLI